MADSPMVNELMQQLPERLLSRHIREQQVAELEGVQGTGEGLQNPTVGLSHQLGCTLQHVADGELPDMAGAVQKR